MRVTKAPEVRRDELLDVAFELCRSHGFEAMSVEQVTRAAGVAKGTFYHYFSSKSDLQWQLVRRFGDALFAHLSASLATADGTGAERLRVLMDASAAYKADQLNATAATFLYREENFALRHRLFDAWREQARLVLLPVIRDGRADGSLDVDDPDSATDLVLLLWLDAADRLWLRGLQAPDEDSFVATMLAGSAAIWQAQERILGAAPGSFAITMDPGMVPVIRQLYTSLDGKQE